MKEIFTCLVGSRLYGLATPDSDYDFKTIVLDSKESIFGVRGQEETSQKIVDGFDMTVYPLRKFMQLCVKGNPTCLEVLSVDGNEYDNIWNASIRPLLSACYSSSVYSAHIGYIDSQIRLLQKGAGKSEDSKRAPLVARFGYDTKAASHAARLSKQLIAWHRSGEYRAVLSNTDIRFMRAIKDGEFSKEECLSGLTDLLNTCRMLESNSTFPDSPDYGRINQALYEVFIGAYR